MGTSIEREPTTGPNERPRTIARDQADTKLLLRRLFLLVVGCPSCGADVFEGEPHGLSCKEVA